MLSKANGKKQQGMGGGIPHSISFWSRPCQSGLDVTHKTSGNVSYACPGLYAGSWHISAQDKLHNDYLVSILYCLWSPWRMSLCPFSASESLHLLQHWLSSSNSRCCQQTWEGLWVAMARRREIKLRHCLEHNTFFQNMIQKYQESILKCFCYILEQIIT